MSTKDLCEPFIIYPWHAESFSFSFLYSFLIYYVIFASTEFFLKFSPLFKKLSSVQKRNFTVYVVELFATTILVVPLCVFGIQFYAQDGRDIHIIRGVVLIAVFLCSLYLYELAFKLVVPKSLLIHHIATIVLTILSVYRYHVHGYDAQLKGIFTMSLHALTEQPTWVALILYRVKKEWSAYPLLFAAIFSLVTKTAYLGWTIQIVATQADMFWWYAFGPIAGLLFLSQIYGAYILFSIYRKVKREERRKKAGVKDEHPELQKNRSLVDVGMWGRKGSKILRRATKRDQTAIDTTTGSEIRLEKHPKRFTDDDEPDEEKGLADSEDEDQVELKILTDHAQPQSQTQRSRWVPGTTAAAGHVPQILINSNSLFDSTLSEGMPSPGRPRAYTDLRPDDGPEAYTARAIQTRPRSNSTGGV